MDYIQFEGNGDMPAGITHLDAGPGTSDFTLCGASLDQDAVTVGASFSVSPRKITCPECIGTIKFCRDKAIKI